MKLSRARRENSKLSLSFLQREEEKYKGKERMRDMSRQHEGAN